VSVCVRVCVSVRVFAVYASLGLLERMKNAKIEPDVIVYSAAICACGKTGLWESALKLFKEMQVYYT
jgi:pentatricopeptide repeat protein